jgi:hypothetical protein
MFGAVWVWSPPVEGSHHKIFVAEGLHVIAYPVMLDVSRELVGFVAGLLRAERRRRGTRRGTRALSCAKQATFVVAWLRDRVDVARLGAGFGICRATAYRYLAEGIDVLAAKAPDLHTALERAQDQDLAYLILDGKVFATDRLRESALNRKGETVDAWYSGKTHDFGGLIQAIMAPNGVPLWLSEVLPGRTHDITAARAQVLPALSPYTATMPILADPGYEGAGAGVLTPVKQPQGGGELDIDTRAYNALLRGLRALGERGFALLVGRWKTLRHTTASPRRITQITRAALTLTHHEHKMTN